MKTGIFLKRIGIGLSALLLGISCMMVSVYALGSIDPDRKGSVSVYFGENGTGFPGVEFSFYRAADISADGTYTLTGDFEQYPVSFEDLDSSGWRALAQTLDGYAVRDGLDPLITLETGQDGRILITGLPAGLYLVAGEQYTDEGIVCTPEPMLLSLPGLTEDGMWSYEIEASCKFDREDVSDQPVSCKVQKVWKDIGYEDERPAEITVQLLENGTVADTVVLNRANDWEYTWEDLDAGSRWQVSEAEVPDGYTVTVTQEGNVFVMTNTRPSKPPSKLPQTGMLWWPVPVLVCGGALMVTAGLVIRQRGGDTDEE